ncbi:MAG: restriction endonuclease subunit S [Anaerorhabdus sp.]
MIIALIKTRISKFWSFLYEKLLDSLKKRANAWELRRLGKLGDTFTGLTGKTKEDFGHGDAKFVTYVNVFNNTITDLTLTENVEIDAKQNQVEYGDILFTTSSETPEEVGMSSVWLGKESNVYLNSFCFGYRPILELDPYYMAFMLRSSDVRKKFILLAQGISRYNISKTKVMEMEVPLPNIEEQTQIGAFFQSLDNLITLHQRELEQLKNIKKTLLKHMFV